MRVQSLILVVILLILFSPPSIAKIIYVPEDSSTIQAGINGARDRDTVLVLRGHYYERINFHGKKILVASYFIFDSLASTIEQTIIDADPDSLGDPDTGSVVCFVNGEDLTSIIKGFTIQNGIGTLDLRGSRHGGGIYCDHSSPTISNNIITADSVTGLGGGIYCLYSSSTISYNTLTSNFAGHGAGITCYYCTTNIVSNIISGNIADYNGGGMNLTFHSQATISSNTVNDNSAERNGGGIYCTDVYSSVTIANNIIGDNSAERNGGGIYCQDHSSPYIISNTINGGSAGSYGGGIYCQNYCSPTVTNNIISNSLDGEGIYCKPESESDPVISYNDVWNNHDGDFFGCPSGVGENVTISCNGDSADAFFNISVDPLFDPDSNNYFLLCNSPCIDVGDPSDSVPLGGGRYLDMGKLEYPYVCGDANGDDEHNPQDITFKINFLFKSGPAPCPLGAADDNCDCIVNITDVRYEINYFYHGGPPPVCGGAGVKD